MGGQGRSGPTSGMGGMGGMGGMPSFFNIGGDEDLFSTFGGGA